MTNHRLGLLTLVLACASAPLAGCYVQAGTPQTSAYEYESEPPQAPPPQAEVVPPPPAPDTMWVAGSYRWNGRAYDWQRGRYERRPHGNAQWIAGHWEHRGNRHLWVEGHWV